MMEDWRTEGVEGIGMSLICRMCPQHDVGGAFVLAVLAIIDMQQEHRQGAQSNDIAICVGAIGHRPGPLAFGKIGNQCGTESREVVTSRAGR